MFSGICIGAGIGFCLGWFCIGSVKAHVTAEVAAFKTAIAAEFASLRAKITSI